MQEQVRPLFDTTRERWNQFRKSRAGRRVLKAVRWCFLAGIVAYLAYQLTDVGWGKVWRALPTTPWFYIILLLMYATLPVTEAVLYGKAWNARFRDLLPALLRKRVLNNEVIGYSGEAYFYLWMRGRTNLSSGDILRTIKDNTIISSIASTTVAFSLLAIFFLTGQIDLLKQYLPDATTTLAAGVAVVIVVVSLGVAFRRAIFSLPARLLWMIGAGHLIRFLLKNGLQVVQWIVVVPDVPVGTWITLIALHIVISQIPFLPARSLIFMSASVELSGMLQVPTAAIASMLLAQSLIDRGLNLLIYVGTTALDARAQNEVDELEELSLPEEIT